ncbi:threonine synthase [Chitinophaga pinensis]|uniref:Threonine synthase n=1 Tax=Chitinophaga pinensis (strain ATCC 43595 / DSM 2588 / LMG 13176 / NBRC 15968 / NCIMB 11800 / UQM 2034) TaxID=485918 RepID=A0A979G8S6_CHIPD|nr:threonine synthase [Chitinophaga pinensis]ACU62860.1 threonine synthase [Chitinophaga pinensis DSM 2588]
MKYFSLQNKQHVVSFEEAVVQGLAPDKGLYFPERIPAFEQAFLNDIVHKNDLDIAYAAIQPFVGEEIPEATLRQIIADTLSFPFPVEKVEGNVYSLELFHGPTLAFKDVGARFMAGCLGYFRRNDSRPVTVLVATSGDTGGAVANGFYNVPGVRVVILYPSGKVSTLQEKQLTTLNGNITALEIDGTFDDCQRMVKTAFLDEALQSHVMLTSANSINVARWLPQMFYYLLAYKQLSAAYPDIVFSVPSGNFGNICAGMMAAAMGLPVKHFVASTNVNDTVPRFMQTGAYTPGKATATLSNAMDVADPSNFVRILELFANSLPALKEKLTSISFNDKDTAATMEQVWKDYQYMLDPHGAVGYLGLKQYLQTTGPDTKTAGVFLETAHPVKFADTAPASLQDKIVTPDRVQSLYDLEKQSIQLPAEYNALKQWLMAN